MRKFLLFASHIFIGILVLALCVMVTPGLVVAAPEAITPDYGGLTAAIIPADGPGSACSPSLSNVSSRNLNSGGLLSGSAYVQFDSMNNYCLGAVVFRPVTQGGVFVGQHGFMTASTDNGNAAFAAYLASENTHNNSPMLSPGATTLSHGLLHPDVSVDCAFVAGMFSRESLSHEFIACSGDYVLPIPIFGLAGLSISVPSLHYAA